MAAPCRTTHTSEQQGNKNPLDATLASESMVLLCKQFTSQPDDDLPKMKNADLEILENAIRSVSP